MKLMNNVSKEEKKLIRKMFWRSGAMYASVNPVTMGGGGFCYSMIPFINHFYKDNEEKRREALARHVKYFSTTIPMASFVMGIAGSMEKENSEKTDFDAGSINSIKLSLMGPLAGIGDTIGWAMIPTIFGSIAASMGMEGNPLGIFLWAAFTFVFLVVRILQYEWGYGMGVNVITKFGKQITVFTEACSVLGLTVVGSLVATVVKLSTGLQFKNGDVVMKVQELIDGVMPALLPVAAVGIIYYFMKVKKVKMTWMILFIIVASMIGAATGIFTA